MRVHRARSGRTPMPGVAPGVTERARVLVQSAYEAIASCENKMFGEMYAEALRRRVYENDPYLFNFMKSLEQAPVGIEEFLDSPEFLGATDIVLWPEVRKAVIEINKNWWKGPASAYSQALLLGATGSGKCLARGTPVMRYDGSVVAVEDIRVGDLLMGPDSTPRKVLSLSRGEEEMFRVTPRKGDSYTVNKSHILSLKVTSMGRSRGRERCVRDSLGNRYWAGDIVDISVADYLASSATFRHVTKGWRVGVDFLQSSALELDPYYVGLWLGDGTSKDISITTDDPEIVAYLRGYARAKGLWMSDYTYGDRCRTVSLAATMAGGYNPVRAAMQRVGLSLGQKFIPKSFLTASREDRLLLLAGLVDSDGHLSCGGYEITTKHLRLRDDILFLARSLGFAAYSSESYKTSQNGNGGYYHRIFISGDISTVPVILDRKRASARKQRKDVLSVGLSVESVGVGEYFGFTIDGDRRFLLGDFTVTHNTEIAKTTTLYQLYLLSCVSTPQALYGLPQSTSIVFAIMAAKPHVTKKVIYMPLRKAVETIPYFQKHLRPDRLVESEMIFPSKNIRVTPGGSDADTILGEAIIGGIIDEVNFMNVVLKSKRAEVSTGRAGVYDQAQSIHSAMTRRKKGRFVYRGPQIGVICVSSSTRYKGDFTDKLKLRAIRDKDQTIYIYDKKQYEVRPQDGYCGEKFKVLVGNEVLNDTRILKPDEKVAEGALVLEIPIEYLPDFRTDIFGALRDVCGISTSSISPFYRRPFKIQEAIDRGREAGLESFLEKDNVVLGVDDMPRVKMGHYCQNPSRPRYVHIDLSVTGDSAGIGMARYDGMVDVERANGIVEKLPKVTIELACSIKPDPNNEIQFAEIRAWIKRLKDVYGYPIKAVTYDGIFSTESIQAWRRMGMKTGHLSVDRTSIPCKQFRDALYDGRVDMYEQEVLQREMELLEYNEVTDKVDHLPSESKDVHDGVVGAYTSLLQRRASWQSVAMDDQSDEDNKRAELGDRFDGGDRR